MNVIIRWREVNDYSSTITLNDDEVTAWWAEVKEVQPDAQMSEGWLKDFLENGDESAWFDDTDTNRDYDGTAERYVVDVVGYEGGPA